MNTTKRILESINPESKVIKKELTYGDILVGRSFNPSKNSKVDRIKELFAEATDIVRDDFFDRSSNANGMISIPNNMLAGSLLDPIILQILHAQMDCVKLLTLEY